MAKRSQRRQMRYEKDQAGCIWGFISIFDLRNSRPTRKLLSDRRRTSKQVAGAGHSRSKLHLPTNLNGNPQRFCDGEERDKDLIDHDSKTPVKELMKEEMCNEQDEKKLMTGGDIETKQLDSEHKGRRRKNRRRTSKTSKSSCDVHCELHTKEKFGLEIAFDQDREIKFSKDPDIEAVINELCQQIYQKSTSSVNHDWNNELRIQYEQADSVLDKKLLKAINMIVDQRYAYGNHLAEDWKIDHSKEIMDALQTLSSNKEMIFALLKDPSPLLRKCIEDSKDDFLDPNSNSLASSNLLDKEQINSKPSEIAAHRHHSFFRRKIKSQERIPLKEEEKSHTTNRIVILKPGPARAQISDCGAELGSSLQPENSRRTKLQTERPASQFSFTEIKRRLKHAMGKERHSFPSDAITQTAPYERQNSGNSDKGIGGEKGGWNSPNRNHFYNERFAGPATGIKNKDKSCKPKDTETSTGNGTPEYPKLRVSSIYIEAKKHLSEMLSNGDETEELLSRQLPKSLGRVLSLPDYNSSPACSPGRDKEYGFVVAQKKLFPKNSFHPVNEDMGQPTQENHVSHQSLSRKNLKSQSCIRVNAEDAVQSCNSNSDALNELCHSGAVEETMWSTRPEKSSKDGAEIVETTDVLIKDESKVDIAVEQCSSSDIKDDQSNALAEVCDEDESAQYFKLDSSERDQFFSSPLTSPPNSSVNKQVGDLDSAIERQERPSPVSVLEPLFTDDDISPASVNCHPAKAPMQFHFEEQISSATDQAIHIRASLEDDESPFEYVEAVLLASDLNWEEYLSRWISSDQIIDSSLFDEVGLFSSRPRHDQKLLFDCTNEVLKEVCERYFDYSPWVSTVKHNIRPTPMREDLIHEVWEGIEWHLQQQPSPRTLDQIIKKEMAKGETWMDLRTEVESIGTQIGEAVFKELLEDTILSFVNEGPEISACVLLEEQLEIE